jgi:2-polyprenyl-6-methoxyphenol hydroxylase-like FAD-dependent oxidoreductase
MNPEVLIVGAGPTGLVLALWLSRLGVRVRIIDKSAGPGETSRALAVQARTLEFHRQIGIVDDILAAGVRINQLTVRTPAGLVKALDLSDFGASVSRYSFAFALPQDIHERVLIAHLGKSGVEVERLTELSSFTENADGITATLRKNGTEEAVHAAYICGCDGAHSTVRHALSIGFPGGAYEQSFYVADVEATGPITRNGLDVVLGSYGFAVIMPVRQLGSVRVIGVVPKAHENDAHITFDSIRADVERDTGLTIGAVNWFSTYHVHHRVADHFRVGRAFIAGDAGHIHSPAGGQGMNTGMGDAVNLAWKLAAVVQGRADARLLDTYEPERIAFARLLIASTDRAFRIVTGRSAFSSAWRRYVMPYIATLLFGTRWGARTFFALISQTRINYRGSAISIGTTGKLRGGDRLPYVADGAGDNFESLSAVDWQVHVYGEPNPALTAMLAKRGLALQTFAWQAMAEKAGLERDVAYLLRPEGHIAVSARGGNMAELETYLADWKIKPRHVAVENPKA